MLSQLLQVRQTVFKITELLRNNSKCHTILYLNSLKREFVQFEIHRAGDMMRPSVTSFVTLDLRDGNKICHKERTADRINC